MTTVPPRFELPCCTDRVILIVSVDGGDSIKGKKE
jgi:hypothetical protein